MGGFDAKKNMVKLISETFIPHSQKTVVTVALEAEDKRTLVWGGGGSRPVYKVPCALEASFSTHLLSSSQHTPCTEERKEKKTPLSTTVTSRLFTAGVHLPLRAHEATNDASNHKRSFSPVTCGSQITTQAHHTAWHWSIVFFITPRISN